MLKIPVLVQRGLRDFQECPETFRGVTKSDFSLKVWKDLSKKVIALWAKKSDLQKGSQVPSSTWNSVGIQGGPLSKAKYSLATDSERSTVRER